MAGVSNILLNISNHPSTSWSQAQIAACEGRLIVDIPFPDIDPAMGDTELGFFADEFVEDLIKIHGSNLPGMPGDQGIDMIHIMGESGFLVAFLDQANRYPAMRWMRFVHSTTRRIMKPGDQRGFEFVRFREYQQQGEGR